MKQKMPARGETGYAVFLTVSGRGIQFPALYRSTCRALTEGKAMERFRVAEAEEYYPGMLESTLVQPAADGGDSGRGGIWPGIRRRRWSVWP